MMTTTDDSKSAVADKLSLSEKVVKKAKEEAERTILIFNRKDSDSWLPLTTDKAVFCFYTDFLRIKNITKELVEELQRQAEEIERLNKLRKEKNNELIEQFDRIAELERQLGTSLASQNKNMQRQINEERNKNKKLEKENQELRNKETTYEYKLQRIISHSQQMLDSLRKSGEKASPLVVKPNGEHSSGSQEGDISKETYNQQDYNDFKDGDKEDEM